MYSDADASIDPGCRVVNYGDGTTTLVDGGPAACVAYACLAGYGPWTPPPAEAGRSEASSSHTYTAPGTYTVRFTARSDYGCNEPYASGGDRTITVVVP